ncbi:MAG: hypothetical protein L0241_24780 [Planctomycetia bacterium]|nr:hypothetical protein [Planctomycetia bacterium]
MNLLLRAAVVTLVLSTATPALAQDRPLPEPVPMGVPYVYQPGNPYWYMPVVPYYKPYPFASSGPVFGRYSWDYGYYYTVTPVWYPPYPYSYPIHYPYSYQYPTLHGRVWMGYGW